MADLHKFIRQQFANLNWARECDLSHISLDKLKEISESFCHLDVKSKLNIILTYCNSDIPTNHEIAKYIDSVILQALDEENNFVRAIVTILHSRQHFGHLTFDISQTNETFAKTLENLIQCQPENASKVPLLAELLDARVTNASVTPSKRENEVTGLTGNCLNTCLGFHLRGKPPAMAMKEAYLDRLHEECERRRIHVPIPGRSFCKQDSEDSQDVYNNNHGILVKTPMAESGGEVSHRRAPSFPRRTALTKKEEPLMLTPDGLRSPTAPSARTKLMQMKSNPLPLPLHTNGASRRRQINNDRPPSSFRLSSVGQNRPSGIMLLDIADLPAVGLKAKKLRQEEQEREREKKRRLREEQIREKKEIQEADKQTRRLAKIQAKSEAARFHHQQHQQQQQQQQQTQQNQSIQPKAEKMDTEDSSANSNTSTASNFKPWTLCSNYQQHMMMMMQQQNQQNNLLGKNDLPNQEDDDDDDYDDDDDEDEPMTDGAFHLTAPRDFRGFNPSVPSSTSSSSPPPTSGGQQQQPAFVLQQSAQLMPCFPPPPHQQTAPSFSPRIRFIRPNLPAWHPNNTGGVGSGGERQPDIQDGQQQQQHQQPQRQLIIQPLTSSDTSNFQGTTCNPSNNEQIFTHPTQQVQNRPIFVSPSSATESNFSLRLPHNVVQQQQVSGLTTQMEQSVNHVIIHSNAVQQQQQQQQPINPPSIIGSPVARLQPRLIQIRPRASMGIVQNPASLAAHSPILSRLRIATAPSPVNLISQVQPAKNLIKIVPRASLASSPQTIHISGSEGSMTSPLRVKPSLQLHQQQLFEEAQVQQQTTAMVTQQPQLRVQDELRLTTAQLTTVQSLFQGANCLSRPEKATILSFVGGSRVNPQPEAGNALRIRLSEYRERVIDSGTGKVMDVAADTYLHLDYATGRCEQVKAYRALPPEMLVNLPVNNFAHNTGAAQ